jgi:molybdate transport system substrate-binding protein
MLAGAVAAALLASGCGGGSEKSVKVSAASSLKGAFEAYAKDFHAGKASFSFAGSDELAAQIRQGVKPDVFASANTKLPDELYAAGLVGKPVVFAANELVLAVPADSAVQGLSDLTKKGTTIAMGSESVPVGSYTRKVLDGLPAAQKTAILGNVRSNEPDVAGVVGKVTQGAVDAGFVYVTDVEATEGKLKAIDLPADLKPQVAYGVAVVKGAKHPVQAQQFIDGLLEGAGREALDQYGFLRVGGD